MLANDKYSDEEMNKLMQEAFLDVDVNDPANAKLVDEVAKNVYAKEWPGLSERHSLAKEAGKRPVAMWGWFLSDLVIVVCISAFGWILSGNDAGAQVIKPAGKSDLNTEQNIKEQTFFASDEKKEVMNGTAAAISHPATQGNALYENKKEPGISTVPDLKIEVKEALPVSSLTPVNPAELWAAVKEANSDPEPEEPLTEDEMNNFMSSSPLVEPAKSDHIIEKKKFLESNKFTLSFSGKNKSEFVPIDNSDLGMNSFLKTNEVSNYEYNLFLNDLLLNGRIKEYEVAKHKIENVYATKNEKLSKTFLIRYLKKGIYEKEHKYRNHPVVCVSTQGMELYCAWLKEQIEAYYAHNNMEVTVTVRLPKIEEWKIAALAGQGKRKYATPTGKLKSNSDWMANFLETENRGTKPNEIYLTDRNGGKQKPERLDKNIFTVPALVNKNGEARNGDYSLQNMSGNVSEVVIETDKEGNKTYRTIGGNWNSKSKFLQIKAADEFNGKTIPSVYIGFRPIVIINQ